MSVADVVDLNTFNTDGAIHYCEGTLKTRLDADGKMVIRLTFVGWMKPECDLAKIELPKLLPPRPGFVRKHQSVVRSPNKNRIILEATDFEVPSNEIVHPPYIVVQD